MQDDTTQSFLLGELRFAQKANSLGHGYPFVPVQKASVPKCIEVFRVSVVIYFLVKLQERPLINLVAEQCSESDFPCSITSHGAHHGCNALCGKMFNEYHLKTEECEYLDKLGMTHAERFAYKHFTKNCYFQNCQYECRVSFANFCLSGFCITLLFKLNVFFGLDQRLESLSRREERCSPVASLTTRAVCMRHGGFLKTTDASPQ